VEGGHTVLLPLSFKAPYYEHGQASGDKNLSLLSILLLADHQVMLFLLFWYVRLGLKAHISPIAVCTV